MLGGIGDPKAHAGGFKKRDLSDRGAIGRKVASNIENDLITADNQLCCGDQPLGCSAFACRDKAVQLAAIRAEEMNPNATGTSAAGDVDRMNGHPRPVGSGKRGRPEGGRNRVSYG